MKAAATMLRKGKRREKERHARARRREKTTFFGACESEKAHATTCPMTLIHKAWQES